MKIFEGYIFVSEMTQKANKAPAWLYLLKNVEIEKMGHSAIVKTSTIPEKYQHIAKQCQDLKYYCSFAYFSVEIGRSRNNMAVISKQRKIENKKINGHRLIKLSEEFVELVQKNLTPFKLTPNCKEEDYVKVIEIEKMKIGFY